MTSGKKCRSGRGFSDWMQAPEWACDTLPFLSHDDHDWLGQVPRLHFHDLPSLTDTLLAGIRIFVSSHSFERPKRTG